MASRRKLRPVALRLWLSPDLPLSQDAFSYDGERSQFWNVPIDVGFGSQAESITRKARPAALAVKAEIIQRPGRPTQCGQEETPP